MLRLDDWKKGHIATILKSGFLKDNRNTVTTTNIYSHVEEYFRKRELNDYYFPGEEPGETENNNKPLPYDIFKDEEYEPHEYKEPPNNWAFIKISNRSGEYITAQLRNIANFSNMTRLNLYGLLKESKEAITKLTDILRPLASNERISPQLTHLNIGDNNLIIVDNLWTGTISISKQFATNINIINLISRFTNLVELNVSNNKISNVEAITALVSVKQAPQRQIPKINMANNLICKNREFYFFKGQNNTERIIPKIQKIIDDAIKNNGALIYLNISENNLDPNKINSAIYQRVKYESARAAGFFKINVKNSNPRLMLKNFIKFTEKDKLPILDLSSTNMKYQLPIVPTDDYVTNINIETYLKKYVGKDEDGKDKDPIYILNDRGIVNYINALNDKSIGDQNLLIKRMSYEDRKLRLIDIINYHQIMMGLSENEKKQLCNEMVAYNAKILEANEGDSTNLGFSLGVSGMDPTFQVNYDRGYHSGVEVGDVEKGKHSPWESYRIRKPDFGFPLQLLASLLEKHDVSSFRFFERNQSLINSIVNGTNIIKFLCKFLENVGDNFYELNLSNCSLSTNLFISICDAIKKNSKIKITHINLSDNDLTNDGIYYLCDILEKKQSIRNINISNNINVKNAGLAFIAQWLLTKDVPPEPAPAAPAPAPEPAAPPPAVPVPVPPVNLVYSFQMPNPNELDNIEKCHKLLISLGLTRRNIYNLKKLAPAPAAAPPSDAENAVLMNLPSQANLKNILVDVLREINNPPPVRGGKRQVKRKNKTIKKGRRMRSNKKSNTYKKNKRVKNKNSNKNPRYKKPIKKQKTIKKK